MIAVSDAGDSWTLSKRKGATVMEENRATQINFDKKTLVLGEINLRLREASFPFCESLLLELRLYQQSSSQPSDPRFRPDRA